MGKEEPKASVNHREVEKFYKEHGPKLFNYLYKVTRDKERAEDLLQETFVQAIKNIENLRDKEKAFSWLLSIGLNIFRDGLRREKTLTLIKEDIFVHQEERTRRAIEKRAGTVKDMTDLSDEDKKAVILKLLEQSSLKKKGNGQRNRPNYAPVIIKRFIEGKSREEIMEEMEIKYRQVDHQITLFSTYMRENKERVKKFIEEGLWE